ncbi:MAG: DUF3592 domain-containing protein [Phycisphaeraceae bacterium]
MIGKLVQSLFLSIFALAGLAFLAVMGWALSGQIATYTWDPAPATIVASDIDEDRSRDNPYRFTVEYTYQVAGQDYTSNRYQHDHDGSDDYSEINQLLSRYPAHSQATCYVNPDAPAEAVLERPSLGDIAIFGAFGLIPLLFVVVGFGGIYYTWRSPPRGGEEHAVSVGHAGRRQLQGRGLALFFLVFFLFGSVFFTIFFLWPTWGVWQARQWQSVTAEVLDSRVRSHSGDDGTTYSIDIEYAYEFNGQPYRSNRYDFTTGSSSGRASKQAVVNQHPSGKQITVYVNPANPHQAVINRSMTGAIWLGGITAVFPLVGLSGLVWLGAKRLRGGGDDGWSVLDRPGRGASGKSAALAGAGTGGDRSSNAALRDTVGPVTLKPESSRVGGFVGLLLFGLVWNGIVFTFLVPEVIDGWRGGVGVGGVLFTLFGSVFVLVGLGVVGGAVYQGMRLFNPTCELQVTRRAFRLGEPLAVRWQIRGPVDRLQDLAVTLEGREEAEYTHGTRTSTDKHTFARLVLAEVTDAAQIRHGDAVIDLPERTMPSLNAGHNRIIWTLRAHGSIRRWPDMDQSFALTLLPRETSHG